MAVKMASSAAPLATRTCSTTAQTLIIVSMAGAQLTFTLPTVLTSNTLAFTKELILKSSFVSLCRNYTALRFVWHVFCSLVFVITALICMSNYGLNFWNFPVNFSSAIRIYYWIWSARARGDSRRTTEHNQWLRISRSKRELTWTIT